MRKLLVGLGDSQLLVGLGESLFQTLLVLSGPREKEVGRKTLLHAVLMARTPRGSHPDLLKAGPWACQGSSLEAHPYMILLLQVELNLARRCRYLAEEVQCLPCCCHPTHLQLRG